MVGDSMNLTTVRSLFDELVKIADSEEPGFFRGIGRNLRGAAGDLTSPISNARQELGRMKTDVQDAVSRKSNLTGLQRAGKLTNHGMTVAFTAPQAVAALKKDPTGQTSRAERVSRFVGSTIGNLATAKRGISGSILGSVVGDQAGKLVGKGINKVTGFKPKKLPQEKADQ
jgi:hypothetical protein